MLLLCKAGRTQEFSNQQFSYATIAAIPLRTTANAVHFVQKPSAPLCLFVLLSPECPLCKNYSLVLNTLHKKFKNSMQVFGIVPGKTYSGAELEQFAVDYKIGFPLLIDGEKKLADYLNASVTPEVILTDSTGQVVYRGAIDDWMQELGRKKLKPQQHYLEQAIGQYLNGEPVRLRFTTAKGCLINEF